MPSPSRPLRVLVAGCGDLGTELGLRMAAEGHEVFGLRRRPERLPPPLRPVAGDLTGVDPLELPGGIDVVAFTAGAGRRDVDLYRTVYLGGLQRLLASLERHGSRPHRVLFVSSTAVYGDSAGDWVDEDTPPDPATDTGAVLVEAEAALAASGLPTVAFRLSGIYGPGRTRLVDQVRRGEAVRPHPPAYSNRMHRDDAARAIAHLLTLPTVADCYLGVDDAPVDRGEVLAFLAAELGLPQPPDAPTGPDPTAAVAPTGKRCRNDRLQATGFVLHYPTYREGYRAVLAGEGVRHR